MGCLKLTYLSAGWHDREETSPLRVSRDEKEVTENWQVWTGGKGEKETKEVEVAQSGGRPDLGTVGNEIRDRAGSEFGKNLFERYWLGQGDVALSQKRFLKVWDEIYSSDPKALARKGRKQVLANGAVVYAKTVNFYNSQEYALAFGRATVFVDPASNSVVGFYDEYNFDPKDWGVRSGSNELKTMAVNAAGALYGAQSFRIYYGAVPSKYWGN